MMHSETYLDKAAAGACCLQMVALMPALYMTAAILLIKAAQQWQQQHKGQLPSSSAQRTEFKGIIKQWQRQIEGIPLEVCRFGGGCIPFADLLLPE